MSVIEDKRRSGYVSFERREHIRSFQQLVQRMLVAHNLELLRNFKASDSKQMVRSLYDRLVKERLQLDVPLKRSRRYYPMDEILPGLFLGGYRAAYESHFDFLIKLMIESVKNLESKGPLLDIGVEDQKDFSNIVIKASSPKHILNPKRWFERTFKQIDWMLLNKKRVLVFCMMGFSRSPTFIMAYLINRFQLTFDQACQYVRSIRPEICPCLLFKIGLMDYADALNGKPDKEL